MVTCGPAWARVVTCGHSWTHVDPVDTRRHFVTYVNTCQRMLTLVHSGSAPANRQPWATQRQRSVTVPRALFGRQVRFPQHKVYAAEVLHLLLHNDEADKPVGLYAGSAKVHKTGGEVQGADPKDLFNGTHALLKCLAGYRKRDEPSQEEIEYAENVFNCLCECLMLEVNRELFLKVWDALCVHDTPPPPTHQQKHLRGGVTTDLDVRIAL